MNNDEMKNLIANLFAKADFPDGPPAHKDTDKPDLISVSYVYAAHAFIKDAIKLVENHQENNTDLDQDKLFFLLNGVKNTLEISFQNLHQFLPEEMKKKKSYIS